jgi:hypothetical protein
VHTNRNITVSNPAFPTSGLETLGWKQAVSTSCAVETVRFQPSVSNLWVGNTGLETGRFHVMSRGNGPFPTQRFQCRGWKHWVGNDGFPVLRFISLQPSFGMMPGDLWISLLQTGLNNCQIVGLRRLIHFMSKRGFMITLTYYSRTNES